MIRIYTAPSCASCRKVKAWLKEHHIPYVEKNIFSTLLREVELKELLERSENGTDDIISKRSKIIKENKVDLEDMSVNQLIHFIQENPSILKRPIIIYVCTCMYMCMCLCGGQRLTSRTYINLFLPYFLRQSLLLRPRVH